MVINANSGPNINYGVVLSASGAANEYNEERGPSLCDLGEGLLDPRPNFGYKPGNRVGAPVYAWAGLFGGPVIDQIPTTLNTSGIAASQSATAATGTLTLQTSAGSSSFTTISGFVPSTYTGLSNPSSITVLGIDCAPGTPFGGLAFGSGGTVNLWDPTHAITRALTFNSTGTNTGATFTVNGFDLYGFAMHATAASTATNVSATTLKAFKYIQSITWSGAGSTTVYVGTADVYGFPMKCDHPAYTTIWWGASSIATLVTLANHAFASSATATSSTGDVRGTFTSSAASNSTAAAPTRMVMTMSPSAQNLWTIGSSINFFNPTSNLSSVAYVPSTSVGGVNGVLNVTGLVGVPQF